MPDLRENGPPVSPRLLSWLYRRLGRAYLYLLVALELSTAFFITAGATGLIFFYYELESGRFALILAANEALTLLGISVGYLRYMKRLQPVRRWVAGQRGEQETLAAWDAGVNTPARTIGQDMLIPILLVTIPSAAAGVAIGELNWLAFFPIFAGALVATGYAGLLHLLIIETVLRPVILHVNEHLPTPFDFGRGRFSLRMKLMAGLPLINIITGLTVSALTAGGEGGARSLGFNVLVATGVAFTISFELTALLSKSILRPIGDIKEGMDAIRRGDYDSRVPVTTSDELGELSAGFNEMAAGLAERERIREAFGTYLDREVAEYILGTEFETGGVEIEVSLLFCDVRGFTQFAADSDAPDVVAALNRLFEELVPIVSRHGGHVDKFIGDGLLAVFGAPEPYPDHADRALAAAIEMAGCVRDGRAGELEVGIGVNSGPVVAGNIGGAGRLNFSVIGDAVNVASRVESATRELDVDVLLTADTRRLVRGNAELRSLGRISVRGRSEEIEVFCPTAFEPVEEQPPAPAEAAAER